MSEKVTVINGVTYTDTFVDDVLVSTVWVNSDGTGRSLGLLMGPA